MTPFAQPTGILLVEEEGSERLPLMKNFLIRRRLTADIKQKLDDMVCAAGIVEVEAFGEKKVGVQSKLKSDPDDNTLSFRLFENLKASKASRGQALFCCPVMGS